MKNIFKYLILSVLAVSIFNACTEEEIMPGDKNSLFISFDNRLGAEEVLLGTTKGVNSLGEDFTVTRLNYFISNISLTDMAGKEISFPNQYFLIREADEASQTIELKDVPAGDYKMLNYTIGVDSLKSISEVAERTGVLDPASYGDDNMYWSWNAGYIFFKMEGNSSKVSMMGKDKFELHIGGFGGKDSPTPNNLEKIQLQMENANVRKNIAPEVHVIFDVAKVFDGVKAFSLAANPMVHNPAKGTDVSNNYAKGFSVDHVHAD